MQGLLEKICVFFLSPQLAKIMLDYEPEFTMTERVKESIILQNASIKIKVPQQLVSLNDEFQDQLFEMAQQQSGGSGGGGGGGSLENQ